MKEDKPCMLTIAGSDSSGGAGIQADIKTISAMGCYAASVITALTAQNTLGVQAIYEIEPRFVKQQLESVFNDLNIKAVKIGMLHNEKIISVVSSALQKFKPSFLVLDPVMMSKNGCELIDLNTIPILEEMIFPYVTLITPNVIEAELLLRIKINTPLEQASAAKKMGDKFKVNVLIKGGHLSGEQSSDLLYLYENKRCHWFHAKRIYSQNTHGTGCSLSSAIASYLAKGCSLKDAIDYAKKYLTKAIESGVTLQIGHGCGPVDHFYFLENEKLLNFVEELMEVSRHVKKYERVTSLLKLVAKNIEEYEAHRYPAKPLSPIDILEFLMEEHGLGQSDLPEIGGQSLVSKILSGERKLTVEHIQKLSKRFGVSSSVFIEGSDD